MKRFRLRVSIVVLIGLAIVGPTAHAQIDNFQDGLRIITVGVGEFETFYYARANGDVYKRGDGPWQEPPEFLGNFFFGQPVPSDFLAGLHAVTTGNANSPLLYYASSTGELYRQGGTYPFDGAPGHEGSFFNGQPVPADFQKGFHIVDVEGRVLVPYYASQTGDVYSMQQNASPAYLGNFFNGLPLATSPSTLGGVKSKYR
jgi:hypothetical protein